MATSRCLVQMEAGWKSHMTMTEFRPGRNRGHGTSDGF